MRRTVYYQCTREHKYQCTREHKCKNETKMKIKKKALTINHTKRIAFMVSSKKNLFNNYHNMKFLLLTSSF